MPVLSIGVNTDKNIIVGNDRKIHNWLTPNPTLIYPNNYQNRALFAIGKTFVPSALNGTLARFAFTHPALQNVGDGGALKYPNSFTFTNFVGQELVFEVAEYNPTTGFIAGSMLVDLLNTNFNLGYVYVNNPDITISRANSTALNANAIASWHLPDKANFKPGIATSDFNSDFTSTTGLRGAAASFNGTNTTQRSVRSSLLNGQNNFSIEFAFQLNSIAGVQSFVAVPLPGSNTELNIRTSVPSGRTDADGLKLRMIGSTGAITEHFYDDVGLVTNKWYHLIVGFRNTGVFSLYLNGELKASTSSTVNTQGAPAFTGTDLIIGGGNISFLNGKMDDILVLQSVPATASAAWRARNSLYPNESFVLAELESPGIVNDIAEGIFFRSEQGASFIININNYVFSPAGRTAIITSFVQPSVGSLTQLSSTQLRYTPPNTTVLAETIFHINVSTS